MCPAKVITPQGITFFVKKGEDIHNSPAYDTLPLRDKRYLAFESIKGNGEGFALTSDFHEPIVVTENCPPLILPEGTRIEPLLQKPSLREK